MRVFILGIDGATFRVILPLVERNILPTFKKIMKSGCWGVLKSTIPPLSGPAWVSFSTGSSPKVHGIFDFIVKKPGSYEYTYINSSYVKIPFFWEVLGDYDKRVGVIYVMVTYPPRPVNGFLITGGLTPSLNNFTYPPELGKKLLAKFNNFPFFPPGGLTPKKGEDEGYIRTMLDSLDRRTKITEYLAKKEKWDLFISVFDETDSLQHAYLGLIESSNYAKQAIVHVYKKIDDFMKKIIDEILGEEDILIVMSDHGHSVLNKYFLVNNFLLKIGVLQFKNSLLTKIKRSLYNSGMSPYKLYSFVRSLGFKKVQSTFRGGPNEQILTKITLSYKDIDWEKTKAFSFGVGGGIYINVNGKEKMGCVNPEEYEIVREQIIKVLYSVRDSKEHKSIIKAIYKKEEIYGENINAPDLIFLTNEGYATLHLSQFVSSSLFEKAQSTGTHSPDGILLVYGRDIRKGFKITHSKIQDIAPTILHIFNVPIPHYMDGKVLKELFQQKSDIYKRPIYRKKLLKGLELTKKIQELRSKLNM